VDIVTGPEVSLSLFYLVPVAFVAWTLHLRTAMAFGVLSGVVLFVADRWSGATYSRSWIPYVNAIFRTGIFVAMTWVISSLRSTLDRERSHARTDPVTGLYNRRQFLELAEIERERAVRYGHPITLAYVDLDGFKSINDRLGHAEGDVVLRRTAEAIRDNVRSSDIVGRLGGDEFAVLFPETDAGPADVAVAKVHDCIGSVPQSGGATIGFVTFESPPRSVEAMVARADRVMYQAKTSDPGTIGHEVADGRSQSAEPLQG
jgi:diguanylate cyclase (GGDEF)-like protein